ncbi:MAG: hypothetical protein FWE24_11480 [Defluviitaleaceae bacterium]|nr:hypothetical protein [Defluviitaleaceae bacterium]
MIVMHENTSTYKSDKPVICRKCNRGKLGTIPHNGKIAASKRGKPPPNDKVNYLQVKCPSCSALWLLAIEA